MHNSSLTCRIQTNLQETFFTAHLRRAEIGVMAYVYQNRAPTEPERTNDKNVRNFGRDLLKKVFGQVKSSPENLRH